MHWDTQADIVEIIHSKLTEGDGRRHTTGYQLCGTQYESINDNYSIT